MSPRLLRTNREQRVQRIYEKILIARLILIISMVFVRSWHQNGAISDNIYHLLMAVGFGLMCISSVYMLIISVATGVSVFYYFFIHTETFEATPVLYMINILLGIVLIVISGVFTYGSLVSLSI